MFHLTFHQLNDTLGGVSGRNVRGSAETWTSVVSPCVADGADGRYKFRFELHKTYDYPAWPIHSQTEPLHFVND